MKSPNVIYSSMNLQSMVFHLQNDYQWNQSTITPLQCIQYQRLLTYVREKKWITIKMFLSSSHKQCIWHRVIKWDLKVFGLLTTGFLVAVIGTVIVIVTSPESRYAPSVLALKLAGLTICVRMTPYDHTTIKQKVIIVPERERAQQTNVNTAIVAREVS